MLSDIMYFDAHCDTMMLCQDGGSLLCNSGHIDLCRGEKFSAYAQIFALYYDMTMLPGKSLLPMAKEIYRVFLRETDANADKVARCADAKQVEKAITEGKCAALLGIEGAELIDSDPENIELAASWGTKYITITHNHANGLSGTNQEFTEEGLTDRGSAFIKELYRNGILPDMSHLSDQGIFDTAEMGLGPIIASHSNSRKLCDHPRNLSDDLFRVIAQTGGVVGLNFYSPFVGMDRSFDAVAKHLEHFLNLGGETSVALGGDMDGCDDLCCAMTGLESVPTLYKELRRRGFDDKLLKKVFWENWFNLF